MDNKEELEEKYKAALEKFSLYIKAVYELLENKNKLTILKREEAKQEWQIAIKEYKRLLSLLKKKSSRPSG